MGPKNNRKQAQNTMLKEPIEDRVVPPESIGVSQPHFEGSARSPLTLPKMGLGSPPGLPKTHSTIAGVKTPCIEAFFIPLKRS